MDYVHEIYCNINLQLIFVQCTTRCENCSFGACAYIVSASLYVLHSASVYKILFDASSYNIHTEGEARLYGSCTFCKLSDRISFRMEAKVIWLQRVNKRQENQK